MQIHTGRPPSWEKNANRCTQPHYTSVNCYVYIYIYIEDNGNNELLTSVRSQPQTATKRAAVVSEYP